MCELEMADGWLNAVGISTADILGARGGGQLRLADASALITKEWNSLSLYWLVCRANLLTEPFAYEGAHPVQHN